MAENSRSWGTELWDCEKHISSHCDSNIAFMTMTRDFIKDRAKVEKQYASELKAIVDNNQKQFKAFLKTLPKDSSTLSTAWDGILSETRDIMKQHEGIGDDLIKTVTDPMKVVIKSKKSEKEAFNKKLAKLQKDLEKAESTYENKKKAYEKANKDATDAFNKAQAASTDTGYSESKLRKLEEEVSSTKRKADETKAEYDIQQDAVTRFREKHYSTDLKKTFDAMQVMEQDRIQNHKKYLATYAEAFRSKTTSLNACLEGIEKFAASVDATQDADLFIESTKTGNTPEMRIYAASPAKKQVTVQQVNEKRVTKKKIFKTTHRKKDAIREDFVSYIIALSGHLQPEQRRRAIANKVQELTTKKEKELKAKNGFVKTIEAYTKNPAMGDAKSLAKLNSELQLVDKSIVALEADIYKFGLYLEAIAEGPSPAHRSEGGDAEEYEEEPFEDEDIDDDDDDESGPAQASPSPTHIPPPQAESPEGALPATTALYSFAGVEEGELPITEGESLLVTEADTSGSGWVRVRNTHDTEGYVPTSYIQT